MSDDDGGKPSPQPAANPGAKPSQKESAPGGDQGEKPADSTESGADAAEPTGGAAGRGHAAAAASPGGTRARNAQRDSARRNLEGGVSYDGTTTQHGDTVLGTKHVYYQATADRLEMRATVCPASEIDRCLGTHVRTVDWTELTRTDAVLLLRGTNGSGRNATALVLLNEVSPRETLRLDPKTRLEALASDRFNQGAGYVLDGGDGTGLTAFEVQRLEGELHDRKCRLIVTVSDRFRPADPVLTDHIVDLTARPAPIAVVRAHVDWHTGARGRPPMTALLDQSEREILDLLPQTAQGLGHYATLAELLVTADGDLELVGRRLAMRDSDDFEEWFDSLGDLYTQCFAIALSVLNSLPHQAVAEAAHALELYLDPKEERQKRSEAAKPFTTGRRRLLEKVRATVAKRMIETRHGETPAEVVTFIDPGYPRRLLAYVWQEHDEARGPLMEWLQLLGAHGSDAVRVAAAIATGHLAVASFDFVRARVLVAWALDEHQACHDSAAIALEAPAGHADLGKTVTGLVTAWARSGEPELAATAARSCGVALGGQDPDAALKLLDELVVGDEAAILATCESLAEWAAGDDVVLRNRGITAVYDWSVDRDPEKRTAGQLAFLWMAMDLVNEDDPWPALLRFAAEDGTIAHRVVALWSSALVNPELSDFARRVLATWADTVNADNAAISAFVDLCGRTGNRSRAVIKHQAKGWLRTDAEKHCPRTASAVLNAQL
jgi:hypothetical protein